MNIHAVKLPGLINMLVWGYARGGNGRTLGPGAFHHAYQAERQQPPALGSPNRRYWGPWGYGAFENTDPLTPLCGRMRSNARHAQIISTYARWIEEDARVTRTTEPPAHACPECLRLGGANIRYLHTLIEQDPWTRIDFDMRLTTPDPVTGL